MKLRATIEPWRTAAPFRISGQEFTRLDFLVVELERGGAVGRGEAAGVGYLGDLAPGMLPRIAALADEIADGLDRDGINRVMPAGGARNALDCAFWDIEAKRAGVPVWRLAGLAPPRPIDTFFTIGIDTPGTMAARATAMTGARRIKLKLAGDGGDADRVRAVRAARGDVAIAVDANQGFTPDTLGDVVATLADCGVILVEQPLARGREADMAAIDLPMPVAADESVQAIDDLDALIGRFDIVNIKLDKCGGLTHALAMAARARAMGLGVMVGNMLGTSLSHAPAYLLGQICDHADLDGPTLMRGDRTPAVRYVDGRIDCPDAVWGGG